MQGKEEREGRAVQPERAVRRGLAPGKALPEGWGGERH